MRFFLNKCGWWPTAITWCWRFINYIVWKLRGHLKAIRVESSLEDLKKCWFFGTITLGRGLSKISETSEIESFATIAKRLKAKLSILDVGGGPGNVSSQLERQAHHKGCSIQIAFVVTSYTLFFRMFHFGPLKKHQKTKSLWMFSEGSKRNNEKNRVQRNQFRVSD